jgi:hypothetical protein
MHQRLLIAAVISGALAAGCASAPANTETPAPAARAQAAKAPQAVSPAQIELEREIRASGIDQVAKSFMNEETIGFMFDMFRSVSGGKDADVPPALEKKMAAMSEDLPKKLAPVMAKVLVLAEQEMKRALKEQLTKDEAAQATKK